MQIIPQSRFKEVTKNMSPNAENMHLHKTRKLQKKWKSASARIFAESLVIRGKTHCHKCAIFSPRWIRARVVSGARGAKCVFLPPARTRESGPRPEHSLLRELADRDFFPPARTAGSGPRAQMQKICTSHGRLFFFPYLHKTPFWPPKKTCFFRKKAPLRGRAEFKENLKKLPNLGPFLQNLF